MLANVSESPSEQSIEDLVNEFQDIFNEDSITPMTGETMHIHLCHDMPGYKPLNVSTASRTPLHYKKEAEKLICNLEASGIIVKVAANERVNCALQGY